MVAVETDAHLGFHARLGCVDMHSLVHSLLAHQDHSLLLILIALSQHHALLRSQGHRPGLALQVCLRP